MKNIYRIIDANINRAMEGIRVVEDVVRFVFNDKALTATLKDLRVELRKAIYQSGLTNYQLLSSRATESDVGADLYSEGEAKRTNIAEIVTFNLKRSEEAIRVLEETSKLINPKLGKSFKNIRFKLYSIEKRIVIEAAKKQKLNFDLYVITDPSRSHIEVVKKAIASEVKIVQLRDKTISKREYYKLAKTIRQLTMRKGITFIINDYVDICKATDADGVHIGQGDIPVSVARDILGEGKIIGVSTHSLEQAIKAEREGADYISVGPIFETPLKPWMKPVGLDLIRKVEKEIEIPFVAIGGINESNIYNIKRAGAKKVAVIRAVTSSKDIKGAVLRLRRALKNS